MVCIYRARQQAVSRDPLHGLSTLASQLPVAILARMLGIDIRAAVQWQKAASGDWMTYAADLSRRPPGCLTETPPSRSR
jgi:hypothetical protein